MIKLINGRTLVSLLIMLGYLIGFCGSSLAALSQDDTNSIYGDTVWYLPSISSPQTCSNLPSTPGSGASDGAQFPNLDPSAMADAINTWVAKENPNSRMVNLGGTIVASAKNSNISPFLIVAIAAEESSLADPTDYNVQHGNNSFGRSAAPGQPSFQGARDWYYWSSVKASVDYTASENQGISGGGDMATYLRDQFGSLIDSSTLLQLFTKYAPAGDGNDPVGYAAKVQGWIDELVKLANGTPTTGGDTTGGTTSCGSGIFGGDIVKTAIGLAWPSGDHGPNKSDATPEYQTALPRYNSATDDYSDCGGFVATVMHASGADTDYVGVYVPSQYDYVSKTAAAKYQIIRNVQDTTQLQAGDILMYVNLSNPGDSHTFIYVGQQSGFDGDGAAASLGGHVPEAVSAAASFAYNGRALSGNYFAVRLVK